jgi:hypothetical protein
MSLGGKSALGRWWGRVLHRLFMSCQQFMRQESARRVTAVGALSRVRGLGHRLMCRICRAQVRNLEQMTTLSAELGHPEERRGEPPALSPEARARLREKLVAAKRDGREPDAH